MNANEVIEKILSDANNEAQQIKDQGADELSKLKSEYDSKLDKFNKQTQDLAQKAADDKTMRLLAAARMEGSKKILQTKRAGIDSVFKKALEKLQNLDNQEYLSLMESLLGESVETGDESVIVGKNETRITDDFMKQVNRNLGTGFKGNLLISSQRADISGGFILQRGDVSINVSLEVLVEMARDAVETQLAKELFQS